MQDVIKFMEPVKAMKEHIIVIPANLNLFLLSKDEPIIWDRIMRNLARIKITNK